MNVAELNWLMGFQPISLNNWISNGNTDINKQHSLVLKKTEPYLKK